MTFLDDPYIKAKMKNGWHLFVCLHHDEYVWDLLDDNTLGVADNMCCCDYCGNPMIEVILTEQEKQDV